MSWTFLGAYNPAYARSAVIRRGLKLCGLDVRECRVLPKFKFWARYPLLLLKYFILTRKTSVAPDSGPSPDFLFVPEFCQKDVPLAKGLSLLAASNLIFDPLASRYETKIVDWKRRPPDSLSAWWNFKIDVAAFRLADLILADTAAHRDYYCRTYGLDAEKIEVLPLGYDDEFFKPARRKPEQNLKVLFYGSFLPLHGVETIAEAARIVAVEDASIRFRLAGSGQTLPQVREAVETCGLRNVEFLGWLSLTRLRGIIAESDICLGLFGRTEKAARVVPHKIYQSLGMQKAVITARTPAVEEFFRHRENLFLCDEPLAESLARAILELKEDVSLRERIALNGFQLVKERHSPKTVALRLLDIVQRHFH